MQVQLFASVFVFVIARLQPCAVYFDVISTPPMRIYHDIQSFEGSVHAILQRALLVTFLEAASAWFT
jgi:hypothetical protein